MKQTSTNVVDTNFKDAAIQFMEFQKVVDVKSYWRVISNSFKHLFCILITLKLVLKYEVSKNVLWNTEVAYF